jgi:quercetin dioxygenase-like cupin family protein
MADTFVDERGEIRDLTGALDAVTQIYTVKGAVRGNHFHKQTRQITYVVTGSLLIVDGESSQKIGPLGMVTHEPGVPHAWEALEDSYCLVFTRGPRAGKNYEADTYRLKEPLL